MTRTHAMPEVDRTVYPVSDNMGTSAFELLLRELLRPLVQRFFTEQARRGWVGSDQFIYWQQYDPSKCVAPDLYLCPTLDADACPASIKLWELPEGAEIPFALEVVSENKLKDYLFAPRRYEELGTRELVIYDPQFEHRRDGCRFQVYRRLPKARFGQTLVTNEDRVYSKQLKCWLRVVSVKDQPLLRIATGEEGEELFPTGEEAERAARFVERNARDEERAAKEAERAAKEAERAAKELERAAREAAEARIRELEALLAKK